MSASAERRRPILLQVDALFGHLASFFLISLLHLMSVARSTGKAGLPLGFDETNWRQISLFLFSLRHIQVTNFKSEIGFFASPSLLFFFLFVPEDVAVARDGDGRHECRGKWRRRR